MLLVGLTLSTDPFIRSPEHAGSMLLSDQSTITPEALHAKLDRESALVLNQHNPPFWRPATSVRTPMFWLAAERDAVISLKKGRNALPRFTGRSLRWWPAQATT